MSYQDSGLVEAALSRFAPAVIAITSETRDLVDVSPVLQYISKDALVWKSIYVIDRIEVCHWFVQNVTDPMFSSNVAEVKAQLPTPEGTIMPDAHLTAMCIKHRIISIAVGRERARRAEIAATEAELQDLISQLMEDGMNERDATVEAQRTIEANMDEPEEDEGLPPVRDIIIIKGFPNHSLEISALAKMGVALNAIIVLNSSARFGRKEDLGLDSKDGKVAKKRPDPRKPENKKGKGGRDETDRIESLTVQVTKELMRLDTFESSPLRDIAFWTYDIPTVEGAPADDGARTFVANEAEGVTSAAVAQALFRLVEKIFRYREWASGKSFVRVPKLRVRDPPEAKAIVLAPTPAPNVTSKVAQKKLKAKLEPEAIKEEVVAPQVIPELDSVAILPTTLDLFDLLVDGAKSSRGAGAQLAVYGALLQAASSAPLHGKPQDTPAMTSQMQAEQNASDFMDDLVSSLMGELKAHHIDRDHLKYKAVTFSRAENVAPVATVINSFLSLSEVPLQSEGIAAGVDVNTLIGPVTAAAADAVCRKDCQTIHERAMLSILSSVGSDLHDKDAKQLTNFEIMSMGRLSERLLSTAARAEAEGFEISTQFNKEDGIHVVAKRNAPSKEALRRYRASWYLFQGRMPFPLWSGIEDAYLAEKAFYYPPMQDEDDPIPEEEEEDEDEFDEDGNLIPKKVKTYDIAFQNNAEISSQLVQRRAYFDTLGSFLRCYASEVLQANNHGSTLLADDHSCMYPGDGSCISVRCTRGNSTQVSCAVHDQSAQSVFGFHATINPPFKATSPNDKDTDLVPSQSSFVRAFVSHVSGLRISIDTSIHDPSPPFSLQKEVTTAEPPAQNLSQTPSPVGKRSNTPRSKQQTQPGAPTTAFEDSQQNTPHPPSFGNYKARHEMPISTVSVVLEDQMKVKINQADIIISLTDCPYQISVATSTGISTISDQAVNCVVCVDKSIILTGSHSRLKLFESGDIATYYNGTWLLTSISTGNRMARSASGIAAVERVLMATTVADGSTYITRDDGVEITSSPDVTISFPGGVTLHRPISSGRSTLALNRGISVVFDRNCAIVEFADGSTMVNTGTHCLVGSSVNLLRSVFSFETHRLYVLPTASSSPIYHIDCAFGGLRVHDHKDAFHVTPFGRCRHVTKVAEALPLPTDLTVKNTVDVFIEAPEMVNTSFGAFSALAGFDAYSSLQMQAALEIPQNVDSLFQIDLSRNLILGKSVYLKEKSASFNTALAVVEQDFAFTPKAPWLTQAFIASTGASCGLVSVTDSDVSEVTSSARQSDPLLSNVTVQSMGDNVFTNITRCLSSNLESLSRSEVRSFVKVSPTTTVSSVRPPQLDGVLAALVKSIPAAILAQRDGSLMSKMPDRSVPVAASKSESKTWPNPINSLHYDLSSIRKKEPKYVVAIDASEGLISPQRKQNKPTLDENSQPKQLNVSPPQKAPRQATRPRKADGSTEINSTFANPQPPETIRRTPKRVMVATPTTIAAGPVMARVRYSTVIQLTNVSTGICRFRVTCSSPWVTLHYRMTPLAAGMTSPLEVEINGLQPIGEVTAVITVAHEGGALDIPLMVEGMPSGSDLLVSSQTSLKTLGYV